MRTLPIRAVSLLLLTVFLLPPASADEVVLTSGAKLTGKIEKETEDSIVIVTELGRMTIPRSRVKEVRRDAGGAVEPEEPGDTVLAGKPVTSVADVDPSVAPAPGGSFVAIALRSGAIRALRASDAEPLWTSEAAGGEIAGLAADPGGVYVATIRGELVCLHPGNGRALWRRDLEYPLSGAPLLHRRGLFAYSRGVGVFGLEAGTGDLRGLLRTRVLLDTPLATAGSWIVAGEEGGHLIEFGEAATEARLGPAAAGAWDGRRIAVALRSVVFSAENRLVAYDPESGSVRREVAVAGLRSPPHAADENRAYAEVAGVFSAIDLGSRRVAWRCPAAGRVTRATVAGSAVLATTGDGRLLALERSDGRVRWEVDLPGRAASAPVAVGESIFVVTSDGACRVFAEAEVEADQAGEKPPRSDPDADRTVHTSMGFSVVLPHAWRLSEDVGRGRYALGFRPVADSPRFLLRIARSEDRRRFELEAWMGVAVGPALGRSPGDMAQAFLDEERVRAAEERTPVTTSELGPVRIGGREWVRASLEKTIGLGPRGNGYAKRALFASLPDDRIARLEMYAPKELAGAVEEDLLALARSFAVERPGDFTPPPEVAVAVEFAKRLSARDGAGLRRLLAAPLAGKVPDGPIQSPGAVRVPILASRPSGSLREVRLRIDGSGGTRYETLVLALEEGRWVVTDAGSLLD